MQTVVYYAISHDPGSQTEAIGNSDHFFKERHFGKIRWLSDLKFPYISLSYLYNTKQNQAIVLLLKSSILNMA
jgi:hypothetical protein